jgi:hypothetical protein
MILRSLDGQYNDECSLSPHLQKHFAANDTRDRYLSIFP